MVIAFLFPTSLFNVQDETDEIISFRAFFVFWQADSLQDSVRSAAKDFQK